MANPTVHLDIKTETSLTALNLRVVFSLELHISFDGLQERSFTKGTANRCLRTPRVEPFGLGLCEEWAVNYV